MLAQNSSNSGLIIYNGIHPISDNALRRSDCDNFILNGTCIPNNCYENSGCFGYPIRPFINGSTNYNTDTDIDKSYPIRIISPYIYQIGHIGESIFISGILSAPYYYEYRIGQPSYYLGGIQNNGTLEWYGDTINRIDQLNYSGMWSNNSSYYLGGDFFYILNNSLIHNFNHTNPYYQIIRTTNSINLSYPNYHKYINFRTIYETGVGYIKSSGEYYPDYRNKYIFFCNQGKIKVSPSIITSASDDSYDPLDYFQRCRNKYYTTHKNDIFPSLKENESILFTERNYVVDYVDGEGSEDNSLFTQYFGIGPKFTNRVYSIRVRATIINYPEKYIEKIFKIRFSDSKHNEPSDGIDFNIYMRYSNILDSKEYYISGSPLNMNVLDYSEYGVSNEPRDPTDIINNSTIVINNNLPQNSIIGFLSNNLLNARNHKVKYRIANNLRDGSPSVASKYFYIINNELRIKQSLLSDERNANTVVPPAPIQFPLIDNYLVVIESSDTNGIFRERGIGSSQRYKIFNIKVLQSIGNEKFGLSNDSIYENNSRGETIGIFTPIDSSESFIYELTNGEGSQDNSSFYIGGSYNNELKASFVFDYETRRLSTLDFIKQYYIRIKRIEKSNNVSTERNFIITIRNRNDKKPDIILLDENTFSIPIWEDAIIGRFSVNNFDLYNYYDSYIYSLVPYYDSNGNDISDNIYFKINPNENALYSSKLLSKINPVFNTKRNFYINVRATNKEGLYIDNVFNLTASWIVPNPNFKDSEYIYDIAASMPVLYQNLPYNANDFYLYFLAKYIGDDNLNTTYHYNIDYPTDETTSFPQKQQINRTFLITNECSSGVSTVNVSGLSVWNKDKMQVNLQGETYSCDYLKASYNYAPYDCNNDGYYNFVPIKLIAQGLHKINDYESGVIRNINYPDPETIYLNSGINVIDQTRNSVLKINPAYNMVPLNNTLYNQDSFDTYRSVSNVIDNYNPKLSIFVTGDVVITGFPAPATYFNYLISYNDIKKLICEKIPINGKIYGSDSYIDFVLWVD